MPAFVDKSSAISNNNNWWVCLVLKIFVWSLLNFVEMQHAPFSFPSVLWEFWPLLYASWMAPILAIVVPSTIMWILKELWVQFLLKWDQQDWIEMAYVSRILKLFLLVYWQLCCLQCLPSVWWILYPYQYNGRIYQYNGRICQWVGLINFHVECH